MATYAVSFLPAALRDFKELAKRAAKRDLVSIKASIDALATDPRPAGAIAMQGEFSDLYRIRWGDYRVIYRVKNAELVVLVVALGDRGDVYERLRRRMTK